MSSRKTAPAPAGNQLGNLLRGKLLNYFSMVTTVGTPRTVTAQELRIESMFPADEETESEHLILLGQNTLRK